MDPRGTTSKHQKWSSVLVADRLREAAETLRQLPYGHPGRRLTSSWPDVLRDPREAYGYNEVEPSPVPPDAAAIDRMDEVLITWIPWLDGEEVRILWGWVLGVPAALVARRLRVHRGTVYRRRIAALKKLAVFLNRNGIPVMPSADAG